MHKKTSAVLLGRGSFFFITERISADKESFSGTGIKYYKSFEALEETLGKLQLEEPLFITYMAKKSFADTVFSQIKHNNEKTQIQRFIN